MIVSTYRNGQWGYDDPATNTFVQYTPEQLAQVKSYAASQGGAQQGGLQDMAAQAHTGSAPQQPASASPFVVGGVPAGTPSMAAYQPAPQPQPTQPAQGGTNPYLPSSGNQYGNPLGTPTTAATGSGVSNPYMQLITNAIQQQANQNLTHNMLPAIGRGSVAVGGYGDSRQGIAEGLAAGQTQQGVSNALAGLYGNAYNADRSYDLGRIGQDQAFYSTQRGQDMQQQGQSFNQYLQGIGALTGMGQSVAGIGQQQMNAPWYVLNQYANLINPLTGLNSSNQTTQPGSGGGLGGALGGALTAAQLMKLLGG